MHMMKAQDLNTKIITKKPKSARNCESRASRAEQASLLPLWCKLVKAASTGQVKPALQRLFTKDFEKEEPNQNCGRNGARRRGKLKRAVTLVML